jgi:rubredoxin
MTSSVAVAPARASSFAGAKLRVASPSAALPVRRGTTRRHRASPAITRAVAGETLIQVEKPLGLNVKASNKGVNGGVEVASARGNAAKAGLKQGDFIMYTSSFFGDELWPADQVGFVRSALNACPNQVDFIVVRDPKAVQTIDVKRLPKRPAPPRFGKKLSAAQKERATHICVDCGYVYTLPTPFAEQGKDYQCPQCQAPRSRFAKYDVETGRAVAGSGGAPLVTAVATVLGLGGIAYALVQLL